MLIEIIIEYDNSENLKLMPMLKLISTLREQYEQKLQVRWEISILIVVSILMTFVNLRMCPAIGKS